MGVVRVILLGRQGFHLAAKLLKQRNLYGNRFWGSARICETVVTAFNECQFYFRRFHLTTRDYRITIRFRYV